jgi:hypothetical protein
MPRNTHARGPAVPEATPALIRWGAVLGGMIIGLSLLIVLTTLWLALVYGAQVTAVEANITWFLAGSAVVAMLVGGFLAGWLSGVPGAGPGFFNGVTVWGLILIAALAIGTPGMLQIVDPTTIGAEQAAGQLAGQGDAMWAAFVSLLVGALAAGLAGMVGGMITRPAGVYGPAVEEERVAERRSADTRPVPPHTHAEGGTVDLRDGERERADERQPATARPGPRSSRGARVETDISRDETFIPVVPRFLSPGDPDGFPVLPCRAFLMSGDRAAGSRSPAPRSGRRAPALRPRSARPA